MVTDRAPDLIQYEILAAHGADCVRAGRWLEPMVGDAERALVKLSLAECAAWRRAYLCTPWHLVAWRTPEWMAGRMGRMNDLSEHVGQFGSVAAACCLRNSRQLLRSSFGERLVRVLCHLSDAEV